MPFSMAFILKAILLDMSSATPDLLSCPLAWNIFSHPLPFNLYVSFALGWACLGSRLKVFALVPTGTLCLLMASVGPGTIQVVIDRCFLIAIWSLVFPLSLCFSFLLSFPLSGWVPLILCWSPFLFRFLNVVLAFGLGLPCFVIMLTPSYVCSL